MAPHSPGTDQIDTLLWIGLIAAAIVVVLVNAALIFALRGKRREKGSDADSEAHTKRRARRPQLRVAGVLTLFALIIFVLSIVYTEKAREEPSTGSAGLVSKNDNPLTIAATGQQWLWRYDYPNGTFSYYKLVIPVDTAIELRLESTDVVHTWNVPDLAGKHDAVPGKVNTFMFRANDEGTFDGDAATLSGQAYAAMRTEVEVVSVDAYKEFVKAQKQGIDEAQERVVELIENGGSAMSERPRPRPELVIDGFPRTRPRWIQLATSADHKDVSRIMITGALGFLFLAVIELLLMRLQLAIPENSFLTPVAFNRMLSTYGASAVFFFAIPLVLGLFLYVAPLQVGARGTALPRLTQLGGALWVAGGTVLYASFLFTPSEAGVNPLAPLTELSFLSNNGVDVWAASTGFATLGFVLIAIDLLTTLRMMRAPGMAWRRVPVFAWAATVGSWLMLVIGPVLLAAITMLMIDRNYDGIFFADGSGGAPLLWQHLSWIFFTGTYMLVLIFALAAIAEIITSFSGRTLLNRRVVMGSLTAIAIVGTLAWMQNMMTAPIGIGWMYFAMLMSLALIVPFGLVLFNLISTLAGGGLRMRAPLLFAIGAISAISIGLAAEIEQSMVAAAWSIKNTTDATAATHFALVGGAVFGGFAALYYWFPKMTGRTMGESLARISFWTMVIGILFAFGPLFFAGADQGQVIDAYKFFSGTGVDAYNLIATIGSFVLAIGIVLTLVNAITSRVNGPRAGHDPWGGETLEWLALSPPEPHNFDVLPDVRSERPMRDIRDAIANRTARAERQPRESEPVV